ncbi:MAG: hypothetical protein HY913_14210 [Desulfomonile tiedjei]|nr:hypothetical protein [Desulfomonile tiedjei]
MSKRVVYLTDEQWKKIEPLIPKPPPRPERGQPERGQVSSWLMPDRRYMGMPYRGLSLCFCWCAGEDLNLPTH